MQHDFGPQASILDDFSYHPGFDGFNQVVPGFAAQSNLNAPVSVNPGFVSSNSNLFPVDGFDGFNQFIHGFAVQSNLNAPVSINPGFAWNDSNAFPVDGNQAVEPVAFAREPTLSAQCLDFALDLHPAPLASQPHVNQPGVSDSIPPYSDGQQGWLDSAAPNQPPFVVADMALHP